MSVLVTGAAGFVGMHLSKRLLEEGYTVIGYDSVNDYYDVQLKRILGSDPQCVKVLK